MYTLNKYSKRHRLLAPAPLLPGVHFGEAATASSALTKKRKLGPYSIRLAREQEYRSLCLPLVIILPLPSSWHFHYQPIHPPANPHIPAAAASHTLPFIWLGLVAFHHQPIHPQIHTSLSHPFILAFSPHWAESCQFCGESTARQPATSHGATLARRVAGWHRRQPASRPCHQKPTPEQGSHKVRVSCLCVITPSPCM